MRKAETHPLGCANCHKIPSNKFHEVLTLNIRNSPDQGCLAKDTGIAPDYDFSEQERSYLQLYAKEFTPLGIAR